MYFYTQYHSRYLDILNSHLFWKLLCSSLIAIQEQECFESDFEGYESFDFPQIHLNKGFRDYY